MRFSVSRSVLFRMRNVSDKLYRKSEHTFFLLCSWQATGGNMVLHIACWIPKATNTLSEYVILIAFPLQQWSHDRA